MPLQNLSPSSWSRHTPPEAVTLGGCRCDQHRSLDGRLWGSCCASLFSCEAELPDACLTGSTQGVGTGRAPKGHARSTHKVPHLQGLRGTGC